MGLYLGMICGTSMDAIDAALVDFSGTALRIVAASATPFAPELKRRVDTMIESAGSVALDQIGQIDVEEGRAFAEAALVLLKNASLAPQRLRAIGSHGA